MRKERQKGGWGYEKRERGGGLSKTWHRGVLSMINNGLVLKSFFNPYTMLEKPQERPDQCFIAGREEQERKGKGEPEGGGGGIYVGPNWIMTSLSKQQHKDFLSMPLGGRDKYIFLKVKLSTFSFCCVCQGERRRRGREDRNRLSSTY